MRIIKKRTFILLELFIALTLLTFFSFPLVRHQKFYLDAQKKRLLDLEKQRKAEELFYNICSHLVEKHALEKISAKWKLKKSFLAPEEITFDLGKLKVETFHWHYHLYSNSDDKSECRKLYCQICFVKKRDSKCEVQRNFSLAEHGFILTIDKKNQGA